MFDTQISSHRVSKQLQQEDRKSQIWQEVDCKIWMQWEILLEGDQKSPFERHSQEFGLSRASLQRILKKYLQLYPYRIQIKHNLKSADMKFLVSVINHYHFNELHLFWVTLYEYHIHLHISHAIFFRFFSTKIRGAYNTQKLNINFFSSHLCCHIWDDMIKNQVYLWSKLTYI